MFLPRRYKHTSEAFEAILGPFLRKTEGVCPPDSQRNCIKTQNVRAKKEVQDTEYRIQFLREGGVHYLLLMGLVKYITIYIYIIKISRPKIFICNMCSYRNCILYSVSIS